jgi:hypothetical protein
MFSVHLSEQFTCQLVVWVIRLVESIFFLGFASFLFLLFALKFPDHYRTGRKFLAYLYIFLFLTAIYFTALALPTRNVSCLNACDSGKEVRGYEETPLQPIERPRYE